MAELTAGMRAYIVSWRNQEPFIEFGMTCLRGNRQRWVRTNRGRWEKAHLFSASIDDAIEREVRHICYRGDNGSTYQGQPIYMWPEVLQKFSRLNRLVRKLRRHNLLCGLRVSVVKAPK